MRVWLPPQKYRKYEISKISKIIVKSPLQAKLKSVNKQTNTHTHTKKTTTTKKNHQQQQQQQNC